MQATIDLRLFGTLKKHESVTTARFPINPGMTVTQLIELLSIPAEKANLIFVNGLHAKLDTQLHGNEEVRIFPPVCGG